MITPQLIFKIATGLYGFGLLAAFLPGNRRTALWLFLVPAILANTAAVALRYWQSWPMLPMYLGPVALPLCLGILVVVSGFNGKDGDGIEALRFILGLTVFLAASAVCFPKDFYLPFLKSDSVFAHCFLVFGVAGKGCFLVSAAWAMTGLGRANDANGKPGPLSAVNRSQRWAVWGFAFWTVSMFAGELWSYLGWGTPVVWDDAAITTTMATWFFYICLLHLHLIRTWNPRGRAAFAAMGALVVLVLNCFPDMGPLRSPF